MFVYMIVLHDKITWTCLTNRDRNRIRHRRVDKLLLTNIERRRFRCFNPFYYFLLVISLPSHTRPHYLPADDSAVLHADHF